MNNDVFDSDNALIMLVNLAGVLVAYGMLGLSLYLSPDVPLATKGFWGVSVLMLTLSLVNFVKYRFDQRLRSDRLGRIEEARNAKLLEEALGEPSAH